MSHSAQGSADGASVADLRGAVLPDRRRWVGAVLGACIAALDPGLPGADARAAADFGIGRARQVLVILADGLGWHPLRARLGHAPTLRAHMGTAVRATSCAPSTTAAAIPAFATGRRPGRTRMVGYTVLVGGRAMPLLTFGAGVDPAAWQPCPTLFEELRRAGCDSASVAPAAFANSGLTRAALRGARPVGAETLEERVGAAAAELRAGTPLVYLYWSEIDHVGHERGWQSNEWTGELERFDAAVGELLRRVPRDARVVLTADHGMVDTGEGLRTDLAERPDLDAGVRAIAGEGRCVHVHAEPRRGAEVRDRWQRILGADAWVLGPDRYADVLGPGGGCELVGDALVFLRGRRVIVDSRTQSAASVRMIGVHGSLTPKEMEIPVMRLA